MSEIDAINERLNRGEAKFAEVTDALSKITAHLQNQDVVIAGIAEKVEKGAESTQSIVEMWSGGITAARFFCRMADAWKFMYRQVFLPFVVPLIFGYVALSYSVNGKLPEWTKAFFKIFL